MPISYNAQLVAKLLDRAGHPATSDIEALLSLRKADRLISGSNKSLGDLVRYIDGDMFVELAHAPHNMLMDQIAELELARDDAQTELKAARTRIALLSAPPVVERMRTYDELRCAVKARRNVGTAWCDLFCWRGPFTSSHLEKWKREDRVPEAAFQYVARMNVSRYRVPVRAKKKWTPVHDALINDLAMKKVSAYQIKHRLEAEFGRSFSVDTIIAKMRASQQMAA